MMSKMMMTTFNFPLFCDVEDDDDDDYDIPFRVTILGTGAKWLSVLEERGATPGE